MKAVVVSNLHRVEKSLMTLRARLWYLQCVSNEDTSDLHWSHWAEIVCHASIVYVTPVIVIYVVDSDNLEDIKQHIFPK